MLFAGQLHRLKQLYGKSLLHGEETDIDLAGRNQTALVQAFSCAGIILGIGFGFHNLLSGNTTTGVFVLLSIFALSITLIIAHVKKQPQIAALGGITAYGVLSIFLLSTGGVDNTGALWTYPFPIAAVSWLNRRQSAISIAIFYIIAVCVFLMPGEALLWTTYPDSFRWRFFGSFFLVSLASYLVERTRRLNNYILKEEIEKRKITQSELVQAKNVAEKASKAKSTFLANMSHELRTPLGSIIGLTDLISRAELHEPYNTYIRAASVNADLLLAVINDILDLSKIEVDKLELETIDFDIHRVVEDLADALSAPAHEKGLELACLVKRDVPARLVGDPSRLRQTLVNLTSNAIKFTNEGVVTVKVTLDEMHTHYSVVRFEVTDTGIGIQQDDIDGLFNPFSQVDTSTSRRYGGTGLGLAICRRLVELMGGSLGVTSQPGVGSRFWFTARFDSAEKKDTTLPHFFTFDGVKILALCQNQLSADIIREGLAHTGCEIDTTIDNVELLSMLEKSATSTRPYGAVLVEAKTTSETVFKTCAHIRLVYPDQQPKLILILAQGEIVDLVQMEEWGVSDYLVKPIKVTALRMAIGRALGKIKDDDAGERTHFMPVFKPLRVDEGSTNGHVLIVEDNAILRTVVRKYLNDFDLLSHEVTNGREALDALRNENYLLVLMDIQMPDLDGLQTTRLIRDKATDVKNHYTPIIAMTAHSLKGDRERFLAIGMNDYIPKPVRQDDLYTVVARQLSIRISMTPRPHSNPPKQIYDGFDLQDLLERQGYDVAFCRELVKDFLVQMPKRIEAVAQNIEHVELRELKREAHSLKGVSRTAGAVTIGDLCQELESASRGDFPRLSAELQTAMELYQNQVLQWLAYGNDTENP